MRAASLSKIAFAALLLAVTRALPQPTEDPGLSIDGPKAGAFLRNNVEVDMFVKVANPPSLGMTVQYFWSAAPPGDTGWKPTDEPQSSAGPDYRVSLSPPDTGNIRLMARADGVGISYFSPSITVRVWPPNEPPVCTLTSPPGGTTWTVPTVIPLVARARDQDLPGHGPDLDSVRFFNGPTWIGTVKGDGPSFTLNWSGATPGQALLRAVAYDHDRDTGQSATVAINVNAPPTVSLSVSPPPPYRAPAAITLKADAADQDGTVTKVEFFVGSQLVHTDLAGPAFEYAHVFPDTGNFMLVAKAYDNTGFAVSSNPPVSVRIEGNRKPVANPGQDVVLSPPTDTARLDGTASSDPDNDGLAFTWTAPASVNLSDANTARPLAAFTGLPGGDYTLTLVVTDSGQPPLRDTETVVVSLYRAPQITSALAATGLARARFTYRPAATGHPKPSWSFTGLPAWLAWDSTAGTLSGTPAAAAVFTVAMTARNAVLPAGVTRNLSVTIHEAPILTKDLPDTPLTIVEKSRFELTALATGSPAPNYVWQYQVGTGPWSDLLQESAGRYAIDTMKLSQAGNYRVLARNGYDPPDTGRTLKVIVKPLPKPVTIRTSPVGGIFLRDARVTLSVRADGEPPLSYQWFRNDNRIVNPGGDRDSNFVLDPIRLADSGTYRARAVTAAFDSTKPATFAWSSAAKVTVRNHKVKPPTITPRDTSFRIVPLTATLGCDSCTEILYTTNGENPVAANSKRGPSGTKVAIDSTRTLRAQARRAGYDNSDITTRTYTYIPPDQLPMPTLKPLITEFRSPFPCTLSAAENADIFYTLDGSNPAVSGRKYRPDSLPTINATTTVRAIARKAGYADSPELTHPYKLYVPQVTADLSFEPPSPDRPFTGILDVAIKTRPDASVRWTEDGSDPLTSPTAKTAAGQADLRLSRTRVIKAYAFGNDYKASPVDTQVYKFAPGPIRATPDANTPFDKTVTVTLTAFPEGSDIYYTLDGSAPIDPDGHILTGAESYKAPITLDSSCVITAMARYDSVPSARYSFPYSLRGGALAPPRVETADGAEYFFDTLSFRLASVEGAVIRCTLNGDVVTEASPTCNHRIVIDSTTMLQAMAFKDPFLPSKVMHQAFTLMPDTPSISPQGGYYADAQKVRLTARSRRTPIRYSVNGVEPGPSTGELYVPGTFIDVWKSTTLKVVTVSGNRVSGIQEEFYTIFGTRDTVLYPGMSYNMEGGYVLSNPEDQEAAVRVVLASPDSLRLPGFQDVQYSISLALEGAGTVFPRMSLSIPATEARSLYKVERSGAIYFISGSENVVLSDPGTYFMGVDTARPVIAYLGESFVGDSTAVQFRVQDNIANLSYDITRTDSLGLNEKQKPVFPPGNLDFKLKHGPKVLKPLYLRLTVHDYANHSYFPSNRDAMASLSQKLAQVKGPESWHVGLGPRKWDLISIPMALDPKVSLGSLAGRGARVEGLVFDNSIGDDGDYAPMDGKDGLLAGKAYFIGSHSALKSLTHGEARMATLADKPYSVKLKEGWNMIGNPHLDTLWWPIRKYADGAGSPILESFKSLTVRGLWGYLPLTDEWDEPEMLLPWRGYFVRRYGGDTTIELLTQPLPRIAPLKKGAPPGNAVSLAFSWPGTAGVRLGSVPFASDSLGPEDDGELPGFGGVRMGALRQGRRLASDWTRFDPARVSTWRMVLSALRRAGDQRADSLAPLRVTAAALPEGHAAWIVSPARGMKFPLAAGTLIGLSGLAQDTFTVVAGAREQLERLPLLKDAQVSAPPALDASVLAQPGGFLLRLSLPARSEVRIRLWDMRGKRLAEYHPGSLAEGSYRFASGQFRRLAPAGTGIHFLTVEVKGSGPVARLSRKVLLRH